MFSFQEFVRMWGEDRNYKKEYKNYHSRPEQIIRRSKRNEARRKLKNRKNLKGMDVHHKDNDPLNNDRSNLSVVTQKYNRTEPRLREVTFDSLSSAQKTQMYKLFGKGMDLPAGSPAFKKNQAELDKLRKKFKLTEGVSDPEQLAKEIEWAQSPKNVDSKVLSKQQKKDMREITRFIRRLRNPNWVSKFTQIYFTSDKLVQRRLYSAATKAFGTSSALLKKLFPKGSP